MKLANAAAHFKKLNFSRKLKFEYLKCDRCRAQKQTHDISLQFKMFNKEKTIVNDASLACLTYMDEMLRQIKVSGK